MTILGKIIARLGTRTAYEFQGTFKDDLNRQSDAFLVPTAMLVIFAWIGYIPLDMVLYARFPVIVYLRIGLSLVGIACLGLYFTPYFKEKRYLLLYVIMYYGGYSSAVILGMVGADPIYMGGYSIVVLLAALVPLRRFYAFFLLYSSLFLFGVIGFGYGMTFNVSTRLYGLYNLMAAVSISTLAIFVYDRLRENMYRQNLLIQRTNEELQEANKLKSELLAVAAHDLKDPLQVIIGYTDLLQMRLKDDTFAVERLNKIYRSTDQMLKLITGLLEIASIESGKFALKFEATDIGKIAETVIQNQRSAAEPKNQHLKLKTTGDCTVFGDGVLLRQVLENLVGNAVKFSPFDTTVHVEIDGEPHCVFVRVRDEGPGFTEEDKGKVFGKFQRLSARPTGGESSSGLGLALTRELVKLNNGNIRLESTRGEGSTFIVELPPHKK